MVGYLARQRRPEQGRGRVGTSGGGGARAASASVVGKNAACGAHKAMHFWPHGELTAHDAEQCALEQSEDDEEAPSAEAALAAIEADMRATTDLIEVTFVSQLETNRTIELHCEGVHVHDLVCGVTFSTNASARQRWSARCGGATLHAWVVNPRVSTDFVLPAQTPLPEPRVVRERRPTARAAAAR